MCTVKNLGDEALENWIRTRARNLLQAYPNVRATILGANDNDNWEVKIENAVNGKRWSTTLTMNDRKSPENVIKLVGDGIEAVD